jgi:mono/diheme cytochrome c family protein
MQMRRDYIYDITINTQNAVDTTMGSFPGGRRSHNWGICRSAARLRSVIYCPSQSGATAVPAKAGTESSAASTSADNNSPDKSDKSVDLVSFIKSLFIANKRTEKVTPGGKIYQSNGSAACHGEGGKGTQRASALINVGRQLSASQIMSLLKSLTVKMKACGMSPVTGSDEELGNGSV